MKHSQTFLWLMTFYFVTNYSMCDYVLPDGGSLKTNCFGEVESETSCESTRIKHLSDIYVCDAVYDVPFYVNKVFNDSGKITLVAGKETYIINNDVVQEVYYQKLYSPSREVLDKGFNRYYVEDGTIYVTDIENKVYMEIVTTGKPSSIELKIDTNREKLYILAIDSSRRRNFRVGCVYTIALDSIKVMDGSTQANTIENLGSNITAMTLDENHNLIVAIKTENGGKIIRLKHQKDDPCAVSKDTQSETIESLMKDVTEKLLQLYKETVSKTPRETMQRGPPMENVLTEENKRLKRELEMTTKKIETFKKAIENLSLGRRPQATIVSSQTPTYIHQPPQPYPMQHSMSSYPMPNYPMSSFPPEIPVPEPRPSKHLSNKGKKILDNTPSCPSHCIPIFELDNLQNTLLSEDTDKKGEPIDNDENTEGEPIID